ncbi:MAG: glycosyltransferase family 2 protein [Sedimenticola sp.]
MNKPEPSNHNKLVSIITPVRNGQRYLNEAIESVSAQTYPDWEMIIINDNSNDDSLKIANTYAEQDSRIKVFSSSESVGAAGARNLGISKSVGRYIAFLDSDDAWLPDKLKKQIAFMQANNFVFTYTSYKRVNAEGNTISDVIVPPSIDRQQLLTKSRIGCLTVIYDTDFFGEIKMPLIAKRQDLGFWLLLLKHPVKAYGLRECLGRYRTHTQSLSENKISAAFYTWKLFRNHEHMPLFVSLYYFSWYAVGRSLQYTTPKLAKKLGFY